MRNMILSLSCLLILLTSSYAQDDAVQKAINEDVWKPFMESYAALDTDAFMAVHTDDVIRISRDGKNIRQGAEYAESMKKNNDRSKKGNSKRTISFSFLERFATGDLAFEVGYYKVGILQEGEPTRYFYGKFQVVLKKVEGKWKLFVDSDTSNKGKLTEEDFLKGNPME